MLFRDRTDAGRQLAARVKQYAAEYGIPAEELAVLALPRGGVPVGFEVAEALGVPLDVLVVRKLGVPGQEELAMGAIASGDARVMNWEVVDALGITPEQIAAVEQREREELGRREQLYRGDRAPLDVSGKTVLLVDDGLATGSTMRVALKTLRSRGPARVFVAVPVAALATCKALESEADAVLAVNMPLSFAAVGQWYRTFEQTSDEEVRELLARGSQAENAAGMS